MRNKILKTILVSVLLAPIMVFAADKPDTSKLEYMNLPSTLSAESIAMTADYSENDDQATIYLFRGQGCSHCEEMLNYINTIVKDYGSKFKMVSFEVWNNEENAKLQTIISDKLNANATGVPFLIIGKTVVYGFDASKDEGTITKAIDELYESKDRYDVLKDAGYDLADMKNVSTTNSGSASKKSSNDALYVIVPVAVLIVLYFLFRKKDDSDDNDTPKKVETKKEAAKKTEVKAEPKKSATKAKTTAGAKKTTKASSSTKAKATTKSGAKKTTKKSTAKKTTKK